MLCAHTLLKTYYIYSFTYFLYYYLLVKTYSNSLFTKIYVSQKVNYEKSQNKRKGNYLTNTKKLFNKASSLPYSRNLKTNSEQIP